MLEDGEIPTPINKCHLTPRPRPRPRPRACRYWCDTSGAASHWQGTDPQKPPLFLEGDIVIFCLTVSLPYLFLPRAGNGVEGLMLPGSETKDPSSMCGGGPVPLSPASLGMARHLCHVCGCRRQLRCEENEVLVYLCVVTMRTLFCRCPFLVFLLDQVLGIFDSQIAYTRIILKKNPAIILTSQILIVILVLTTFRI